MGEVVRFSDYGRKVSVSDASDACGADRAPVIILPVVRVRQHSDGRAVVYAVYDYDTHFQNEAGEAHKVGQLLDAGGDQPAAISGAADELIDRVADEDMHRHIRNSANECIAEREPSRAHLENQFPRVEQALVNPGTKAPKGAA